MGATRRRANRSLPGLIDATTGSEQGGLQSKVTIDRVAASRLGVQVQDIDNALNNAFAQRQVSTIYTERNQYRVILELSPRFQGAPSNLEKVYVAGAGEGGPSAAVERSRIPKVERAIGGEPSAPISRDHD